MFYDAKDYCTQLNAELVSIYSDTEHEFITNYLSINDPSHQQWYTAALMRSPGEWIWYNNGERMVFFDKLWINITAIGDFKYAVYNYSVIQARWGLLPARSNLKSNFICKIHQRDTGMVRSHQKTIDYGQNIIDPAKVERGPIIIQQPKDIIYIMDDTAKNLLNIYCLASGNPIPEYRWYRHEYKNLTLVSKYLDPLEDTR